MDGSAADGGGTAAARRIGVVGAGTMGSGIAQLAVQSGAECLLHDPDPAALARGVEAVERALARSAERGRLTPEEAGAARERLTTAAGLPDLAGCDLIVEAAPERLELKHALLAELGAIAPEAVLASNTSSIPVTSLAPGAPDPTRVVGMHFFNPAPVMRLVEVIAGMESSPEALALARATGAAMGRRVIDAADGPGFVVNRCNRPFNLEAQKLVTDGVAGVEAVDRVVRLAGGFRMGPFELMDLVGMDTTMAVAESFHALSFGEPRWRPSPLGARLVAAGRLGRKTGRGWYAYPPGRPEDPPAPEPEPVPDAPGDVVVIAGAVPIADVLFEAAAEAGWDVRSPSDAEGAVPFLCVDCGADADEPALQGGPQAVLVADGSLHQLDPGGASAGFHLLPPLGGLVELTRGAGTAPEAARRAEAFFGSLGLRPEWVGDAPGLVLGRIACQLVNEAAFALQEGVGSAEDIDAGMLLGLSHPRGPLAWADEIGLLHVLSVLDALHAESGEERYRAAPLLRRMLSEEATFHPAG